MLMALIILAAVNAIALALGLYALAEYRRDDALSALLLDRMNK